MFRCCWILWDHILQSFRHRWTKVFHMAASAVTPFAGPILDLAVTGSIGNNMFWRWVFWFQAIFVRFCVYPLLRSCGFYFRVKRLVYADSWSLPPCPKLMRFIERRRLEYYAGLESVRSRPFGRCQQSAGTFIQIIISRAHAHRSDSLSEYMYARVCAHRYTHAVCLWWISVCVVRSVPSSVHGCASLPSWDRWLSVLADYSRRNARSHPCNSFVFKSI